jgi:hypothetical protein
VKKGDSRSKNKKQKLTDLRYLFFMISVRVGDVNARRVKLNDVTALKISRKLRTCADKMTTANHKPVLAEMGGASFNRKWTESKSSSLPS